MLRHLMEEMQEQAGVLDERLDLQERLRRGRNMVHYRVPKLFNSGQREKALKMAERAYELLKSTGSKTDAGEARMLVAEIKKKMKIKSAELAGKIYQSMLSPRRRHEDLDPMLAELRAEAGIVVEAQGDNRAQVIRELAKVLKSSGKVDGKVHSERSMGPSISFQLKGMNKKQGMAYLESQIKRIAPKAKRSGGHGDEAYYDAPGWSDDFVISWRADYHGSGTLWTVIAYS